MVLAFAPIAAAQANYRGSDKQGIQVMNSGRMDDPLAPLLSVGAIVLLAGSGAFTVRLVLRAS